MTFSKFEWYWSLAKATDLSDTEFRVLVLLANYADGTTGERAFPSAATLAEQMDKSAKTVRRALAALVATGRLIKVDRPGRTTEYRLVTLDTQMSKVTEDHPGHPDVQGPGGTLDKSEPTLDTAMSTHPGHPDVHRSDQGSDPSRIRSVTRSDHCGQDIGDVQPGEDQDDTGLESRCLAVEGREQPEGLAGLRPATATGSSADDDPWACEPTWRADAREELAVAAATGLIDSNWPPKRPAPANRRRSFGERTEAMNT